ncbi:MAG: ATP-binding protein [Prolixibacteraceae bacterium]
MIAPIIPIDEFQRLEALKEYLILDTIPEKEYDEITFLASLICKTPISMISLIDEKRQWFKSHHGTDTTQIPREIAFCGHALDDKNSPFIVTDSRLDHRFHDNPLVTGDPYCVFYAGVPLVNDEGYALGVLCVIDHEPHVLDESQIAALKALSNQVGRLLELRKKARKLESLINNLEIKIMSLEKFASVAAHDIKSPLCSIVMMTELFQEQYAGQMDEEGLELLQMISSSTITLTQLIDGILKYSKNSKVLAESKENLSLRQLISDIIPLIDSAHEARFQISPKHDIVVYSNRIALEQILINLITNGIKYNDKNDVLISILIEEKEENIRINVIDNGPGIDHLHKDRIFEIFETNHAMDRFGEKGNGIGLATVKTLVEGLGGSIKLISNPGEGANFEFTIKK